MPLQQGSRLISGFDEVRPTTGARGYGRTVSGPSYAQAVKFDLRYPGQVFDEETGLSYNLHRYYDAATGRYMQADPIGLEDGWNRFGYVANNPLNDVDPQGLHPLLTRMQGLYYRYGWQGAVNPGTPSKLQLRQAPEDKQVQDTIPVDMRGKRKNQIRLAFICII